MANEKHLAVINRLYAGLSAGDGEAMAACYTPDATFEDPAFGRLTDGAGQDMWRMLCSRGADMTITLAQSSADDATGSAHWLADYTYSQTGRPVHNDITASFVFRDGLIAEHRDQFDLRAWAAQALGTRGRVLGLTPLLPKVIQKRTGGLLAAYRSGR